MNDPTTTTEPLAANIVRTAVRIQKLSEEGRDLVLFGLVGVMIYRDAKRLDDLILEAEHLDAGL